MRLALALLVLGLGLAVLLFNHDSGQSFGMDNEQFGSLVSLTAIGAMIGAGLLAGGSGLGRKLRHLSIWAAILLVLSAAWVYRNDAREAGVRVLSGLVPGRSFVVSSADGTPEVVLQKSLNGHFEVTVRVNGADLPMMVDTGASRIALSYEDAMAAGFIPQNLTYSQRIVTANGEASAAPVMLSSVAIGPITRRDVPAIVAEPGKLSQSLLGMSFLGTLSSIQMQPDELRLRH